MGKRGPAPTPTNLRVLRGNPGQRALPQNEPKPRPVAPARPTWLDPEAKREWKRIAPELERLGLLTALDGAALTAYCETWATFVRARRELRAYVRANKTIMLEYVNQAGAANLMPHPAIKVAREAAAQLKVFAAQFGLTPAARTGIEVPGPDEGADLDALLR